MIATLQQQMQQQLQDEQHRQEQQRQQEQQTQLHCELEELRSAHAQLQAQCRIGRESNAKTAAECIRLTAALAAAHETEVLWSVAKQMRSIYVWVAQNIHVFCKEPFIFLVFCDVFHCGGIFASCKFLSNLPASVYFLQQLLVVYSMLPNCVLLCNSTPICCISAPLHLPHTHTAQQSLRDEADALHRRDAEAQQSAEQHTRALGTTFIGSEKPTRIIWYSINVTAVKTVRISCNPNNDWIF